MPRARNQTTSTAEKARAKAEACAESKEPSHNEIAKRAYMLYEGRGRRDGNDLSDWLDAETELRKAS